MDEAGEGMGVKTNWFGKRLAERDESTRLSLTSDNVLMLRLRVVMAGNGG